MPFAFPRNNGYANAPQCYVTRTLLVLLNYMFIVICYNITVSLNYELLVSCPVTRTWAAIMIPQIKLRIENRKVLKKNGELERTLKLQQVELFNIVP